MPRGHRQRGRDDLDAKRSLSDSDAYNAGYRRGLRGQPRGGRYQYRPVFEEGYRDGERDRQEGLDK